MTPHTDVDVLRNCINRCLRRPDPAIKAAQEEEDVVLTQRTLAGKTKPPAITGFTAANITRCTELYTLTEMQQIAAQHGIRTTGSALALCARLLQKGLLSSERTQRERAKRSIAA